MNGFPEVQASRKPWFLTTIRVFLRYAFVLGVLFPIFPPGKQQIGAHERAVEKVTSS